VSWRCLGVNSHVVVRHMNWMNSSIIVHSLILNSLKLTPVAELVGHADVCVYHGVFDCGGLKMVSQPVLSTNVK